MALEHVVSYGSGTENKVGEANGTFDLLIRALLSVTSIHKITLVVGHVEASHKFQECGWTRKYASFVVCLGQALNVCVYTDKDAAMAFLAAQR